MASDPHALGKVTDQFIYLEGDIARITRDSYEIWRDGKQIKRKVSTVAGRNVMAIRAPAKLHAERDL